MTTINLAIHVATQLQSNAQLEQAQAIINSILEAFPTQADALHLSGIIAHQKGNTVLAIQLIERAIARNPNNAVFHSNLGEMHRLLKATAASIQCGLRAISLNPSSATALSNLGIAYYDAKEYGKAEEYHKQALAIHPTLSSSLNNMGSIYKTRGNIQQAIKFYQAAIAVAPHVEPLNNLATLFLQQQEFLLAFEYLNQAILLAPLFADAHCNMGFALLGLDQVDKAQLYFEKALQLKPNYAEAFFGMSKTHLHKHHFTEALDCIQKALSINPQHTEFYELLVEIHQTQNHHPKALMYLDQVLSLDETRTRLHISKGTILMEMGELTQARAEFMKAAEDPLADNRLSAHYSLVQLQKNSPDSQHLKELLLLANNIEEVSPPKREYIYFALGKCYDDIGEWQKAFTYFTQGCQLKRQRLNYNINHHIQFTQQLLLNFTQNTINHLRTFANPSKLPIFIVGMPRSGTTLVEQILASHPEVYGGGEIPYLNNLIQWPIDTNNNYHALSENYLAYLQRLSPDAKRITDKMPYNFIAIGLIHALFPNAKIIHVKRHPLDTSLSCYTKLFSHGQYYSYDLNELGQYYRCYELTMNHWRQLLPSTAMLEIEYEDLIMNLETETKRLLAYCDLNWNQACLDFHRSKRQVRTASFMQVRQPAYTSSIGRWRHFEKELAPLINILSQQQM